jgi:alpha-tubulin suppressor-like RCC1 family protein
MDISNLIIQLQAKVNDLTYNQLAVAKSIELLKTGQVNYVNSYTDLPAATAVNGYMYYVRGLGLYFSNGITWTRMDPVEYYNTIWSWGQNLRGGLGDNTTVNKSSPVSVVGGFTDWCQVQAGSYHSLGVRQSGTAWAWGCGGSGRLGDNSIVDKSSPVSVVGGFTDWCQVSAGSVHSVAVRQNGSAWAWGSNSNGNLGTNNTVSSSSPVSVVGGFCDWCQINAGGGSSFGIRTNGVLYAWGYNNLGRLGDNTVVNKSSPVSVVGDFTDWCFVSNCNHTLAVRTNGTLWAWGNNVNGALGDNTCTDRSSPVSVVGGFTDWCQASGGFRFSLGLRQNGVLYSWGCNNVGQLGTNTTVSRASPGLVVGGFTDWCQVAAGYVHSLAVRTNGTAWAWGNGNYGRLGDNTVVSKSSPVSVVGGFADWCQVTGGRNHSAGLRSTPDNV